MTGYIVSTKAELLDFDMDVGTKVLVGGDSLTIDDSVIYYMPGDSGNRIRIAAIGTQFNRVKITTKYGGRVKISCGTVIAGSEWTATGTNGEYTRPIASNTVQAIFMKNGARIRGAMDRSVADTSYTVSLPAPGTLNAEEFALDITNHLIYYKPTNASDLTNAQNVYQITENYSNKSIEGFRITGTCIDVYNVWGECSNIGVFSSGGYDINLYSCAGTASIRGVITQQTHTWSQQKCYASDCSWRGLGESEFSYTPEFYGLMDGNLVEDIANLMTDIGDCEGMLMGAAISGVFRNNIMRRVGLHEGALNPPGTNVGFNIDASTVKCYRNLVQYALLGGVHFMTGGYPVSSGKSAGKGYVAQVIYRTSVDVFGCVFERIGYNADNTARSDATAVFKVLDSNTYGAPSTLATVILQNCLIKDCNVANGSLILAQTYGSGTNENTVLHLIKCLFDNNTQNSILGLVEYDSNTTNPVNVVKIIPRGNVVYMPDFTGVNYYYVRYKNNATSPYGLITTPTYTFEGIPLGDGFLFTTIAPQVQSDYSTPAGSVAKNVMVAGVPGCEISWNGIEGFNPDAGAVNDGASNNMSSHSA